jgi:hypothetical protein
MLQEGLVRVPLARDAERQSFRIVCVDSLTLGDGVKKSSINRPGDSQSEAKEVVTRQLPGASR